MYLFFYFGDINCSSEAFLIQPYRRTLRAIAKSLVRLEFTSVAKHNTYVPRCFPAEVCAMFPDASIVDDGTPAATHMDQVRYGASRLPAGPRSLLVTHNAYGSTKAWRQSIACRVFGMANKVMGAPFRERKAL